MIYMVEVYDLHFFGRLLSAERSLFLNITKIWWKFMIYLSQNMVAVYDLPMSKNLQKNRFFF